MTEGLLSRSSRLPRLALNRSSPQPLVAVAGLAVPRPVAAQAEYASPSTTPLATPAVSREAPAGGPRWNELSPAHRKVLAPLAGDWNGLDARSKERWIDVAGRYPKMKPDEQQRANQRMGEWAKLTVAQRTQARMNFQEARSLSKEEREARWKAYQALPEEKKRELAAKRVAATPASGAAATVAVAHRRVPAALDTVQPKNNVVGSAAPVRAGAGSAPVVDAQRPGVTTTLLTRRATPPAHQRDGGPKIAAGPNSVDRTTLLPKRTTVAAASTAASAARPSTDERAVGGRRRRSRSAGPFELRDQRLVAAPLLRRMAAFMYEGVLLFGVLFTLNLVYYGVARAPDERGIETHTPLLVAVCFIVLGVYFIGLWTRAGQTLPMKTWHLRVLTARGHPLSPRRALARYFAAWIWILPPLALIAALGLAKSPWASLRPARRLGRAVRVQRPAPSEPAVLARLAVRHGRRHGRPLRCRCNKRLSRACHRAQATITRCSHSVSIAARAAAPIRATPRPPARSAPPSAAPAIAWSTAAATPA